MKRRDGIIWFVDFTAEEGGDGSLDHPFADYDDALEACSAPVRDIVITITETSDET